ncbi:PQQ-like beta-propeller repeat protein [Tabrizicola sp. J26]|nr:PQQ-like beta-propeller repeat protein [Tabrizicola rongguiensis]
MQSRAIAGLALVAALAACAPKEVILQGERLDVRAPLENQVTTEGAPAPTDETGAVNRSVPISLGAPVSLSEWTHRGSNVRHLAPHNALSPSPQLIWSSTIGEGDSRRYRVATTPVAAGGRVFTIDARSTLTATSTGGGTLWSISLTPPLDPGSEAAGGGLAYGDGKLFVTTGYGELLAVEPSNGAILWRQRFSSAATGTPAVADGTVYVTARDSSAWAIDASNGKVRWQLAGLPAQTSYVGGGGPALTDRYALFPFSSGSLVAAFRTGGMQMWSAPVLGNRIARGYSKIQDIASDPVVSGNTIFVANASGRTVAIDATTGKRKWEATEGAVNTIAVAGGSIFLVNDENRIVRLDAATGDVIWATEMPLYPQEKPRKRKSIFAHYGPVMAGGHLVVASSDGLLRLFNPTNGALVGTSQMPAGAATAPIVVGGTLFVVGEDGKLHAFR